MVRRLLTILTLLGVSGTICGDGSAQGEIPRIEGRRIVMIVASAKWRDEELTIPRKIFETQGATVKVASSSRETSKGMLGGTVTPDMLVAEVRSEDLDALVLVGGVGAKEYWSSAEVHRLARETLEKGKVTAAICLAPVTLARAGLLSGRRATVWASERGQLEEAGATYTGSPVEVDGDIVTANGPQSASAFAEAICRELAAESPPSSGHH